MPLVAVPGSDLCPVKAYRNMTELTPASSHHPAFSIKADKGKLKPRIYRQLQEKIKWLIAKQAGTQIYTVHTA